MVAEHRSVPVPLEGAVAHQGGDARTWSTAHLPITRPVRRVMVLAAQERDVLGAVVHPIAVPMVTVDDAPTLARLAADLARLFVGVQPLGSSAAGSVWARHGSHQSVSVGGTDNPALPPQVTVTLTSPRLGLASWLNAAR
jgi:hypothetical protein